MERVEISRNGAFTQPVDFLQQVSGGPSSQKSDISPLAAAQDLIKTYVEEQKGSEERGKLAPFADITPSLSGSKFLHLFRDSRLFTELYRQTQAPAWQIPDKDIFCQRLAGGVFAQMGYAVMATHAARYGRTLLTGEQTLEVYKKLHPDAKVIEDPFGQTSLEGISVPDGLIIGPDGNVNPVVEYKNVKDEDLIRLQLKGYRHLPDNLRGLSLRPEIVMVVPCTDDGKLPSVIKENPKVIPLMLPVNTHQVGHLVTDMIYSYRPAPESATLYEMRKVKERQSTRDDILQGKRFVK